MISFKSKLIIVFFIFIANIPVFAQDTTDFKLEYAGSGLWSPISDIVIKDDYIYCGMTHGIKIIDIQDINNPNLVKQIYYNDNAYSLAIKDTFLFVGFLDSGLKIYNISNPLILDLIGTCQIEFKIRDIFIRNEYAYLACECGLVIIDISDLNNPELAGRFETPYWHGYYATNVLVNDTLAYLAACNLWIINISNPQNPVEISRFSTLYCTYDLKLKDSILYISDQSPMMPSIQSALTILNVKNPETPVLISSYKIGGGLNDIELKDNFVYLCASASGLAIFDISDPGHPFPVGCFPPCGEATDILLSDDIAFLVNFRPIISENSYYDICGTNDSSSLSSTNQQINVSESDFMILDISDVTNPTLISNLPHPGHVLNFITDSNYAFISNTEIETKYGVTIADISTVDNFEVVSTIITPGIVSGLTLSNQTLYLADSYSGLQIVDISNIESPQIIGSYNTSGYTSDVDVKNDIGFIADGSKGLVIVDVSNPHNVFLLSTFDTEGFARDILIDNNIAYIADGSTGVKIVDVSSPEYPVLLSQYPEPGNSMLIVKLFLQDSMLFCSGGAAFTILDISNPEKPSLICQYTAYNTSYGFYVFENFLYLTLGDKGVDIVDISYIYNPKLLYRYNTNGWAYDICSNNKDYIYVADYFGLLRFKKPIITAVDEDNSSDGTLPESIKLQQNYPNPFNPTTNIKFTLNKKGKVNLSIYNILGQHVKTLINRELLSGEHTVEWNAKDDLGNPVASGIFFYKLSFDDIAISKKMILLK